MTGILALSAPKIDNQLNIGYLAKDSYKLDINGLGGPTFQSAQKKPGPTFIYDYFTNGVDEFEIYRNVLDNNLSFVTIGRYSDNSQLCFYAAGGPPTFVHPGTRFQAPFPFVGFADGISYTSGTTLRLLESNAQGNVNYIANTVAITLTLRGRAPAFGDLKGSTTEETVTGMAQFGLGGRITGTLSGSSGLSGTVTGQLFDSSPTGMTIVFQLSRPNGDIFYGAVGLDAQH